MEPHVDTVRRKEASEEVKNQVFHELLRRSVNGVLPKSATREVATMFHLHVRTVQRFWAGGKLSLDQGIPVSFASRKRGRCGRKQSTLDYERLRNAPLKDRTTLEDACKALGVLKKNTFEAYERRKG
jgi:hypothetical protein